MDKSLIQFLSNYATLNDEQIQIIQEQNIIQKFPAGTVLLEKGQIAKKCFVVLKGCVRSYYLKEGEENNTEFFLENDPIIPISYNKKEPSEYFIECLEDCILSTGSKERTAQFLNEYPEFASLFNKISNDLMANRQISSDRFRNLTPEEHYLEIRKQKPALLERVPQYHLASYLGIKPQSLSRIRNRLAQKE